MWVGLSEDRGADEHHCGRRDNPRNLAGVPDHSRTVTKITVHAETLRHLGQFRPIQAEGNAVINEFSIFGSPRGKLLLLRGGGEFGEAAIYLGADEAASVRACSR